MNLLAKGWQSYYFITKPRAEVKTGLILPLMIIFKKAAGLQQYLLSAAGKERTVGFVPTMGALHAGHLSLLQAAREQNPLTVASIFVNPTQFNDPADFEKYPVTIAADINLLEKNGCDILFLPSVAEMYPEGLSQVSDRYELGSLETVLDGAYRPGHFQGVCIIVHRLLGLVQPHHLYMGQKDYQQCMVIRRLLVVTGLDQHTQLHICPTLREADGLAMSSRNMRLTANDRNLAPAIYKALVQLRQQVRPGDLTAICRQAFGQLEALGFRPDYVEIADAGSLELLDSWDGQRKLVALIAAFLHDVRLIDNLPLN